MYTTKTLRLGVLCSLIVCLLCMAACSRKTAEQKTEAAMAKKGGMIALLELANPEMAEPVTAMIDARLAAQGIKYAGVHVQDGGLIKAELPAVTDEEATERARYILQACGKLELWAAYRFPDLYPQLEQLHSTDSLLNILQAPISYDGTLIPTPAIGRVLMADTARVNAILASPAAQAALPEDVRFRWSAHVIDYEYLELIALKATADGQPLFSGECITDVEQIKVKKGNFPNVSLTMNEQAAEAWAQYTREHVGESIAFVVDGAVYSYPTIMAEIPGGKSQIAGNMTFEEADDMVSVLKHGPLPCEVRIVEENIVNPK